MPEHFFLCFSSVGDTWQDLADELAKPVRGRDADKSLEPYSSTWALSHLDCSNSAIHTHRTSHFGSSSYSSLPPLNCYTFLSILARVRVRSRNTERWALHVVFWFTQNLFVSYVFLVTEKQS